MPADQPRSDRQASKPATHITPEQAKQLFSLVDELIKFSSEETGLPIKSTVKRQMTTRAAVESYLEEKFNDDQDAKRLQRDEIVLKKFGLLDRDFDLKPFLLALLKEQIEAYYDSKTKTVNMLDWVDVDEQKPVLAHELTHALQDQHSDLEKWNDQTPDDVSTDSAGDTDHLAKDEMDTARDAVAEGQATAVMMDYILKPMGKSLVKDPEVMDVLKQQMTGSETRPSWPAPRCCSPSPCSSPIARASASNRTCGWTRDRPRHLPAPSTTRPPPAGRSSIPASTRSTTSPPCPCCPTSIPSSTSSISPTTSARSASSTCTFSPSSSAATRPRATSLRPGTAASTGPASCAAQKPPLSKAAQNLSPSFISPSWRNPATAQAFAKLYADSLGRKYSGLKVDDAAKASAPTDGTILEQVYSTNEGPVVITTRGNLVFIAESFPLDLARKLASLILDAQGTGEMKMAGTATRTVPRDQAGMPVLAPEARQPLTAGLVRFFSNCGVMKAAVDAELRAAAPTGR